MTLVGIFPFGEPVLHVVQRDRAKKKIFVLGVYASAVHARWIGPDNQEKVRAIAVASEPEIFWRGDVKAAEDIISAIQLPAGAGRLVPASAALNGPSGMVLDTHFLNPLGYSRDDAWLCDLVPHSCMNERQETVVQDKYVPVQRAFGLPDCSSWQRVPGELVSQERRLEIERELLESGASLIVTLGDQPLKWFTRHYGSRRKLASYGKTGSEYGRLHPIVIGRKELQLLPLVHPRQAGRLGAHSPHWADYHNSWVLSQSSCTLSS
jgi:uracil-DNA glycosylase